MKVRADCPGCSARYVVSAETIPSGGKRVACRHCGQNWTITPPREQAAPSGAVPSQARPAPPQKPAGTADSVVSCPHCGFHYLSSAAAPLQEGRPTILLAEDQAFFRNLIRESLGDGYSYLVAATVAEARRILTAVPVSLVILDLNLEDQGDGEQILESLPKGIPALVLTGDQDPDLFGSRWQDLQTRGATDLLIKGLNIREQLGLKVGNILQG